MVGEVATEQRPDDRGDAEDGAEGTLVAAAVAQWDHLADQRGGRDHQRATADSLQGTRCDQHFHRRGDAAQDGADEEKQHRRGKDDLATEQITELADDRGGDRRGEQVTGHDPRLVPGTAQIGDDRGQRRRDNGLIQRREQHAEHHRDKDDVPALDADGCRLGTR